MGTPKKYRLDKTAFRINSFEEADNFMSDYTKHTPKQRLEIAYYLTSIAYKFDMQHPPRMDKSAFCIRKLED